jgi:two-component system sensor histidine kinase VanS
VGERIVDRPPGASVRLKLTLSYAGFLMVAGFLMLAAAWLAGTTRSRPTPDVD